MHEKRIVRLPVDSDTMASIGHCADDSTLEVEFRTGEVYRYFGVSTGIYDGFVHAMSKGAYFHRFVRDRFKHARVEHDSCGLVP